MSDPVVVALITSANAIVTLILGAKLSGRVKRVQAQVENDHSTNLREEQDERHAELISNQKHAARDIGGIREEIRGMRKDIRRERERIDDLEDTLDPRKKD